MILEINSYVIKSFIQPTFIESALFLALLVGIQGGIRCNVKELSIVKKNHK